MSRENINELVTSGDTLIGNPHVFKGDEYTDMKKPHSVRRRKLVGQIKNTGLRGSVVVESSDDEHTVQVPHLERFSEEARRELNTVIHTPTMLRVAAYAVTYASTYGMVNVSSAMVRQGIGVVR